MWQAAVLSVVFLSGCVESNDMRIAPYLVDAVQVSKMEPGPSCRSLGALDGVSGDCDSPYESAYTALRTRAALRGGNYVVIDAVIPEALDRSIIINGRLYACAYSPYPTMQLNGERSEER
jgi:hypothetical protein